ncbi:hypothetical protein LWI29_038501 [Acer saccharum]|uniref:Uncharacterized protein n=1 Tax=Acer saccharum TaxID=4024 RepID=A0AA39VU62_ACESA|nr:hypothetical protein LWI29_038501 [Acer saccharum]
MVWLGSLVSGLAVWKWHVVTRRLVLGWEEEVWSSFNQELEKLKLRKSCPDSLLWSLTPSGLFFVSSFRRELECRSANVSTDIGHSLLWKIRRKLGSSRWSPPLDGSLKFNVDGSSRGNPGPSGGNDYLNFNNKNTNPTVSKQIELVGRVMTNLMSTIEEIYAIGGRKFAFQNVGPLGCMPATRQTTREFNVDCVERYMRHATLHNKFLSISLKEMEGHLPGFNYAVFDYYNALQNRILNSRKYGFEEGKIACCGAGELNGEDCSGGYRGIKFNLCEDPSKYVFFDGGHHSQMTNLQLAQLFWNGTEDVTGPHYNVKKLFELNLTPNLITSTSAI